MDGRRLRDMRRLAGLTQVQAAARLGCGERGLRDMELGRKPVERAYAVALAADHYYACCDAAQEALEAREHAAVMLRRITTGGDA